jgi:cyclophilin family peptidyl-prolyl cis-trans isomerase
MNKFFYFIFIFIFIFSTQLFANEDSMILKLKYGDVKIKLFPEIAPNHVKRFKSLANSKQYDGVVFHRVIDGFMAQTGDVQFGNSLNANYDLSKAGSGNSDLPNLKSEFSNVAHLRGTVSMARSTDPNSANSQFFICLADAPHLDRNYTVFGKVIEGMEYVEKIKKGEGQSGTVKDPDIIISIKDFK